MYQSKYLFVRLSDEKLTVNLAKSELGHANVTFLGHIIGQGQVKPIYAKVEAISKFPVPSCKTDATSWYGWILQTNVIAEPLTNLLKRALNSYGIINVSLFLTN